MKQKANLILTIIVLFGLSFTNVVAQNPLSLTTQTSFELGFAKPFLHSGNELMRSQNLREQGQSYFQNSNGIRRAVGKYSEPIGWAMGISFLKPVKSVKGLLLGSSVRISQTGATSSEGGYEEGYYFNYLNFGLTGKYYPFTNNNLFFRKEIGMGSVFTKNRFINAEGKQAFFHQFGIGISGSIAAGYTFKIGKSSSAAFDLMALYQLNRIRVEVDNIGNDQWLYSGLNIMAVYHF